MEENTFRLFKLAGIETFDPSLRESWALARSHFLGSALLFLALLGGLAAFGGMGTPPGAQLTYPERWERAIRMGLPSGIAGFGAALFLGWAAYSTSRRNYRVAQLGAVIRVGVDRARCALPLSPRLYDPGATFSPVLVCTAEEVLEVSAHKALETPEVASLCRWSELEAVTCYPISRNLLLDFVLGRRYSLCLRTTSGELKWHLKPLFSPRAVARWFSAHGVAAQVEVEPDPRWPEPLDSSGA